MNHQQVAHHLALYRTNPSFDVNQQERVVRASRRRGRRVQPRTTRRGALTVQAPTHRRTRTFRQQSPAISQDHVCSAQNATIRRLQQEKHEYYTQWRQAQAQVDMLNKTINEAARRIDHLLKDKAQARTDLWSQQANIMEAADVIGRAGVTTRQLRQLSNIESAARSLTQIIQN